MIKSINRLEIESFIIREMINDMNDPISSILANRMIMSDGRFGLGVLVEFLEFLIFRLRFIDHRLYSKYIEMWLIRFFKSDVLS